MKDTMKKKQARYEFLAWIGEPLTERMDNYRSEHNRYTQLHNEEENDTYYAEQAETYLVKMSALLELEKELTKP